MIWFAWPALLPLPVESAQPAVITATTEETGLLRWGEYLEDSTGSLSIANVADSHEWKEVGSESVNFGFTPSSYWFRFFVENSTSGTIESFIELNYPMLDYVDCYSPDGTGSYTVSRSGDMLKFDRREIKDRNIMFKVVVRPGLNTFYLRVQTTSSINFAASLLSYDGYRGRIEQEYPIFWAYYGIMIAMLVYNLLIFIMTRNRTYFYYVLFVAAWALFQFTLNGFAFRYLWPDFPWWANKSLPFIIALVAACCGTILRTFMQTKENHPLADRIAVTTIVVPGLIWAGVSFLIPYGIAIRGSTVIALAGSFIMVTMAIILVFRGSRHARFFLLSWLTMLIGIMLYTLKTFGVLSPGFVTNWSIQIGSSATVVLLSGALAQNINVMRRAMIDLNTSLKESETLARERSVYLEKLVSAAKDISSVLLSVTDDLSGMRENFSGLSREQSATSAQLSEKVQEIKGAYASLYRSILSQRDEGERTRELSRTLQKSQESITGDIAAAAEGVSMLSTANNESEQALKNMIEKMQAINEGGESIENFMDIINEITDRINLLSLNAAIEAARAGEHGRGFAVVADEIGKLAAATSQNARQISGRISSILRDISSGTALMNHTKSQLEQTFGMINTISSRTEEVKHLIGGQDSGINQIVSQAGLMEQLSKSIEEATGRQSEALTMTLNAINRMNEIATEVSNAEKRIMEFIDLIRKNSMQLNDLITGV